MRVIVAGSRRIAGAAACSLVRSAIRDSGWSTEISEVVHGDAVGIASFGSSDLRLDDRRSGCTVGGASEAGRPPDGSSQPGGGLSRWNHRTKVA